MAGLESPSSKKSQSQRPREHRQRVLKGATIIVDISKSELTCTVRNQNANGAELRVAEGAPVPNHFRLYVPLDGVAYDTVVRWRKNDRIGVQFLATGPKPKLHYG